MADAKSSGPHGKLGFKEFVWITAVILASNAMAIDSMLPALPQIGTELGVHGENLHQLVIGVYLIGFGIAQIFYGTLSDRFGRRPVLLFSFTGYVFASLMCAIAGSFTLLLAARLLHGVVAAASRVVTVSIIRDCYAGPQMSRVLSLGMVVFMIVPVVAPSLGQLVVLLASWRWIFGGLAILSFLIFMWLFLRLPETLPEERRRPLSFSAIAEAARIVVTDRASIGYTLALMLLNAVLMGFLTSAQQTFADVFHEPSLFTTMFALMAGTVAVASYFNSRLVQMLGIRRLSHGALLAFIATSALHLIVSWSGHDTMASFVILRGANMAAFALVGGSFGAMAMENMGRIAGTAASVQGCIQTVGSALLGMVIGLNFNGSTLPLALGSFVYGVIALGLVLLTERGRLFQDAQARRKPAERP